MKRMPVRFSACFLMFCVGLLVWETAYAQATPEWLARLFPHVGQPGRLANRLARREAKEININGQSGGMVTLEFLYPELDGRVATGRARVFVPPVVREDPGRRVPLVHVAGYEIGEQGAIGLMAQGYAVSTPHAHPLNPLGRGVKLDLAILHAVRQLSFVDPLRVGIQGGSAGGWMALMLGADAFPLTYVMADVPPIHWGYNAAYVHDNRPVAAPLPERTEPRMPVLWAVSGIAEQSRSTYGMPFDSPTYLALSPLAHLETITAPTLAVFSTADVLIPIDQVSPSLVRPLDPGKMPPGFRSTLSQRFPGIGGKRTLLDVLPRDRYALFVVPPGTNPTRVDPRAPLRGPGMPLSLPFSTDRSWSIVVLDEGPMEADVGHLKYHWAVDHEPFRRWAEARGVTAEQLTATKLQRLMKRLRGEPWRPMQIRPGGTGEPVPAHLLDFPEAERADVLLGLLAFASDDGRAVHLARLYARLPRRLQVLGRNLGDGTGTGVRQALQRHMDSVQARETELQRGSTGNEKSRMTSCAGSAR
ncbi:MAG: hypothetical protein RMJ43_01730 [Chloroherpetonaceae bacterium]|nr:hypothetical protein [Chloroherpetonaceae bacterium]